MEYAYATCILSETGEEINEENLTAVLEAAGCNVQESRVKAIVAALEDIDVAGVAGVDLDEVGTEPRQNGDATHRENGTERSGESTASGDSKAAPSNDRSFEEFDAQSADESERQPPGQSEGTAGTVSEEGE